MPTDPQQQALPPRDERDDFEKVAERFNMPTHKRANKPDQYAFGQTEMGWWIWQERAKLAASVPSDAIATALRGLIAAIDAAGYSTEFQGNLTRAERALEGSAPSREVPDHVADVSKMVSPDIKAKLKHALEAIQLGEKAPWLMNVGALKDNIRKLLDSPSVAAEESKP